MLINTSVTLISIFRLGIREKYKHKLSILSAFTFLKKLQKCSTPSILPQNILENTNHCFLVLV